MSGVEESIEAYTVIRPLIENLTVRLKALLADVANEYSIDYHAIEVRAKTVESFSEKIKRPGKEYSNPLEDITDLCGARVILYYQEDIDKFYEALVDEFDINAKLSVDKRSELNYDQFGYVSRHIICKVGRSRAKLLDWKKFKDINIEIQVRTVLQHGWASISHALQYKGGIDTPPELARKLTRLAGLLELADEQFSSLRVESEELKANILSSFARHDYDVEVDAISIVEYVSESITASDIEKCVRDVGFIVTGHDHDRQLLVFLREFGILNIKSLDEILRRFLKSSSAFYKTFADLEEQGGTERKDIKGGRAHWCAVAVLAVMSSEKSTSFVLEQDIWGSGYLNNVTKAARLTLK